jgi:hypothetical protein
MPPFERRSSYLQFTPKRAITSFENLVALANYEETLKGARQIVWRDRGELPVQVHDFWECLEHAGRGGISESSISGALNALYTKLVLLGAGVLAFSIRSGVNFLLVLTRIKKFPKLVSHCLRHLYITYHVYWSGRCDLP